MSKAPHPSPADGSGQSLQYHLKRMPGTLALPFAFCIILVFSSYVTNGFFWTLYSQGPELFLNHTTYLRGAVTDSQVSWALGLLSAMFAVWAVVAYQSSTGARPSAGRESLLFKLAGIFGVLFILCLVSFERNTATLVPASKQAVLEALTYCDKAATCSHTDAASARDAVKQLAEEVAAPLAAKGCYVPDRVQLAVVCPGVEKAPVSLAKHIVDSSPGLKAAMGQCRDIWKGAHQYHLTNVAPATAGGKPLAVRLPELEFIACDKTEQKQFYDYQISKILRTLAR